MRKSHFALFAVAFATLGYVAVAPALAAVQDDGVEATIPPDPDLAPDQQAEFDSWPAEKRAAYEAWPAETKSYYWSLSPRRQMMFWALADSDKIALTAMTGPERDAAWDRIESQAGAPPGEA